MKKIIFIALSIPEVIIMLSDLIFMNLDNFIKNESISGYLDNSFKGRLFRINFLMDFL